MTFEFRAATRTDTKPLIALYGQSGCGKTYSALLLGRGMAGPQGRIGMIDTESGRGSLYADVIEGGYEVMQLDEPFTPKRYVDAITYAEDQSFDVLIVDSASHWWEGIGGVLDMASENEARSGKAGLHNWKQPKLEHGKLVQKLLRAKVPMILCLRAKFKTRQVKNPKTGRNEVVKDDHTSPLQAEDFIYEMTAHAEIMQDHSIRLTKCSHPDLRKCFPDRGPITIEHGRMIAEWSKGGGSGAPQTGTTMQPGDATDVLELAREQARCGAEAFRAWWTGEGRPMQAAIRPHLDEMKALAAEADATPEDPFADTPAAQADPEPSEDAESSFGLDKFISVVSTLANTGGINSYAETNKAWLETLDAHEREKAQHAISEALARAAGREKKE